MTEKTEVLGALFQVLKKNDYKQLQYIPTRKNIFGLFKEWENLSNLFAKKKHLMFYFSAFPSFYLNSITKKSPVLRTLYNFCFLNKNIDKKQITEIFGDQWIADALEKEVVVEDGNGYVLMYSVLPVYDYLVLRDSNNAYLYHEHDEKTPKNRVWVGSDSVKFAAYNRKHFKGLNIKSTLELGCGTGIQLICVEDLSQHLTGIDINPRAVEFTQASAQLNGLESKFTVLLSDLFEKLDKKYDAILANPWFIDLEKAGLEEIPDIIEKLDAFLEPNGVFAMYFGSYVKDGTDQGRTLLTKFANEKGYSAKFYHLGKTIEPSFLKQYKELNISHINSYYALLTKNGGGSIQYIPSSPARQIRDAVFIRVQKILRRSANKL